jgi:hypothetical protein
MTTSRPGTRQASTSIVTAAVAGGAAVLGLLVTSVLLEWFSWQSAFAVLAGVAIAGTIAFVPESAHPAALQLDTPGALLAMAGLTTPVFSVIEAPEAGWASARILGGIGGGLAILAVFVAWELRAADPMLNVRYFRNRRLSAGSVFIFIQFFAGFAGLRLIQGP